MLADLVWIWAAAAVVITLGFFAIASARIFPQRAWNVVLAIMLSAVAGVLLFGGPAQGLTIYGGAAALEGYAGVHVQSGTTHADFCIQKGSGIGSYSAACGDLRASSTVFGDTSEWTDESGSIAGLLEIESSGYADPSQYASASWGLNFRLETWGVYEFWVSQLDGTDYGSYPEHAPAVQIILTTDTFDCVDRIDGSGFFTEYARGAGFVTLRAGYTTRSTSSSPDAPWANADDPDNRYQVHDQEHFGGTFAWRLNYRRLSEEEAEALFPTVVPEPSTGLLVAAGLVAIASRRRA